MLVLLSFLFAKEETVYEEAKTYVQQRTDLWLPRGDTVGEG